MHIMTRKAAEFWWNLNGNSFIAAPDVAFYSREHSQEKWKVTTWKDIFAKRKEKQNRIIEFRTISETKKACFIWVFYNKSWLMGGWYIYIKTLKKDFGISSRHERNESLILKAMQMYPCGIIPSLDNFEIWSESFAKIYHHEGFKRTKQGLKLCACKINEYGRLVDIAYDLKSIE